MSDAQITITTPEGQQFVAPTIDVVAQWAREGRIHADAVVTEPGKPPTVASRHPALASLVVGGGAAPSTGDSAVSTIIPYKNAPALAGYYTSVGSLIPGVGLLAGPAAIVLGVLGLKKVKREPQCHGTAHAWVAIILGSLTSIGYWGALVVIIITAVKGK
jgi:hypothetical protein